MYIWEKYRTFEITSGIILKMKLPLYKGFTLEITNKGWPLTTLNRWPLYRIKIYSKMHRESTKVTVMSRWPLYKGDRYDRFDCICNNLSKMIWFENCFTWRLQIWISWMSSAGMGKFVTPNLVNFLENSDIFLVKYLPTFHFWNKIEYCFFGGFLGVVLYNI